MSLLSYLFFVEWTAKNIKNEHIEQLKMFII